MRKTDAAYLAGLVDGEGSIGIYYNGQSFVGRITVVSTTPAPLKWMKRVVGFGNLRSYNPKVKRHSRGWVYVALSRQAATLIEVLLPFLKIKHKQAKNLLAFQSEMGHSGVRISPQGLLRKTKYSEISKKLNKRGR